MNTRFLSLAAALALAASDGAMAQSATERSVDQTVSRSVAASTVGRWLYDLRGNTVGSVRALADSGRTAVTMVGSSFRPGSHEARVPAGALSVVDDKTTLRAETAEVPLACSRPQR